MKAFVERNTVLLTGLSIASLILVLIFALLLWEARKFQQETIRRFDRENTVGVSVLLGPEGQVSERSKGQLDTLLSESPHVIGGWITRLDYGKTENPIVHYWTRSEAVTEAMNAFATIRASGKGSSSEELNKADPQSLRNSEEAKTGLIKCGPLEQTNLLKLAPVLKTVANGACRATIPPFDENVNLAVVVVIDIDGELNTPDVQEVRRMLLQLQIDIFNRDYQGRETWARP